MTRYTSNSSWQLTGIKRPSSSSDNETITYDGNGRVASIIKDGATWGYSWSVSGATLTGTITDPLSHQRVITADMTNAVLLTDTDALSRTTSYQYDSQGRWSRITYPEGNYVSIAYDARGNVTSTTQVSKTAGTPADIVTSAGYDTTCSNLKTCNQPNWTKDALGNQTDYTYDATHGGLLTVTAPAPSSGAVRPQMRYSYTALQGYYKNSGGSIVASGVSTYKLTGVSSCQTTSSCSGASDEIKATIGYGPQTGGTANNLLPVSVSKGAGDSSLTATATVTYDNVGNLLTVDGPLSGTADTARYRYDAARQVVGAVRPDPDGGGSLKNRATRVTYNADGQVTTVEQGTVNSQSDADWASMTVLQTASTTYDSAGRKTSDAIASGGTTYAVSQYSYDNANRLDCTAVRMNPSTFGSLPSSACTAATTGSYGPDRITKNTYSSADELTKVTTAYGISGQQRDAVTNTYSNNGKLATAADANGNLTTYEYDGFDRLVKTRYPNPTGGGSSTTDYEQLSYDAASNVTNRRLRDGSNIAFSYDLLNRVTLKDLPSPESDISYTYDLLSRPLTATQGSLTLTNSYDALSRLTSEAQPYGTVTYQYDLAGHRTRVTWPDSFYASYDYLVTGEVSAVRENGATSGVGVLASYSYDDLGRRTGVTRGNGTGSSYGYDAVSRLTSLAHDLAGTSNDQTITLSSYNPAGQIGSRGSSNDLYAWAGAVNVNRNYSVNGLNQYTASGSVTPTYDARGNLTSAGTTTYAYTVENMLKSATGGIALTYDPTGRLIQYDATASTRFLFDGPNMLSEIGNPSGTVLRRYVYGPGIDEPIVWYEGSGTSDRRWLHADERGSIVNVTDTSGASLGINAYDEYGIPNSTNIGRFQYTGQAFYPELGLYNYKARFYSATLGRFLQTDPIGYGDGMNWYSYAHGDPINGMDPSGLDACSDSGRYTTTAGYSYTDRDGITPVVVGPKCGGPIQPPTRQPPVPGPISPPQPPAPPQNPKPAPKPAPKPPTKDESICTAAVSAATTVVTPELLKGGVALIRGASVTDILLEGAAAAAGSEVLLTVGLVGGGVYLIDRVSGGAVSNTLGKLVGCK